MAVTNHFLLNHVDTVEGRKWTCACGFSTTVPEHHVLASVEHHIKNPNGPRIVEPAKPVPDDKPRFNESKRLVVTHIVFANKDIDDMYLYGDSASGAARDSTHFTFQRYKMLEKRKIGTEKYFVEDSTTHDFMCIPLANVAYLRDLTVTVHDRDHVDYLFTEFMLEERRRRMDRARLYRY